MVALVGLEKVINAYASVVRFTILTSLRVEMDGRICKFEESVDTRLALQVADHQLLVGGSIGPVAECLGDIAVENFGL